jgi:phage regulator Rha-like protein
MDFLTSSVQMTSLEIATLVEKRHDNVKRTIETLVTQGLITHPQIEGESYVDGSGRTVVTKIYVFTAKHKRDTFVVVAQLSPEFTARLVDRWQELEALVLMPSRQVSDPRLSAMIESLYRLDEMETRQRDMETQQALIAVQTENNTRALEQIQTAINYFTVVGWHSYKKVPGDLPLKDAQAMGREATAYCKNHRIEMGDTPDARYGRVHTYPEWVLDKLFIPN